LSSHLRAASKHKDENRNVWVMWLGGFKSHGFSFYLLPPPLRVGWVAWNGEDFVKGCGWPSFTRLLNMWWSDPKQTLYRGESKRRKNSSHDLLLSSHDRHSNVKPKFKGWVVASNQRSPELNCH
jgi:hypothetical protein